MKSRPRFGEFIGSHGLIAFLFSVVSSGSYAEQSPIDWTSSAFIVFFSQDSDNVEPRFDQDLKEAVCQIALEPETHVVIYGFADRHGSEHHNQLLSERRAVSVANAMARYGMSCAKPSEIKGLGEKGGAGDQPFSRRVEILIQTPSVNREAVEQCSSGIKLGELSDPPCSLKPP